MAQQPIATSVQKQLDDIQENVIKCVTIASDIMELLAEGKPRDSTMKEKCQGFLECVASSQDVVMKMVQEHKPSMEMEQTTYHALAEARLACDKAKFVKYRIDQAIEDLRPGLESNG